MMERNREEERTLMVCHYNVTPPTSGLACVLQRFGSSHKRGFFLKTQRKDFSIFSRVALVLTWPKKTL